MTKTQTQKLNTKNAKAIAKQKKAAEKTNELHAEVKAGKKTAAQALKEKAGETQSEKLAKKNAKANKAAKAPELSDEHVAKASNTKQQNDAQFAETVAAATGNLIAKPAKNGQPISGRSPEVVVTYNFKKDGVVERRSKTFKNAYEAKAFYIEKDNKGKKPKVEKGSLEATRQPAPRKQTLAEAFPVDPVPEGGYKRTLEATGDPAVTQAIEVDAKAAKKAAKALKRKQKKGLATWQKPDTKTVVKAELMKPTPHAIHNMWKLSYSDGTEQLVQHLAVVYSRDHEDHHLRSGGMTFFDKTSNKNYEAIIKEAHAYAQRQANHYARGLASFRGSEAVQKEMDKAATKKMAKTEPLTPAQAELAIKLAELANYLSTFPAIFMRTPEDRERYAAKSWVGGMTNLAKLDLATHGIDPNQCTIRVMQEATRINNSMVPRIEIGGPRIGTPELAAEYEKNKAKRKAEEKAEAKAAKIDPVTGEAKTKAPKAPKGDKVVDAFGNAVGTGCAKINAAVLATGGKEFTTEAIKNASGQGHSGSHLRTLTQRGFVIKTEKGWKLAKPAKAASEAQPAASEAKPAKDQKKAGKAAKAAPSKASAGAKAGKAAQKATKAGKAKKRAR